MDQALPTQFDNTADVFNLMPMYAAMQAGQQNKLATDNNNALQQAFAQEQAQKAAMNPLDLAHRAAENTEISGRTEYNKALARNTNLGADLKEGTLGTDIQTGNAVNKAKSVAAQVAEYESHGEAAGQAYAELKNLGDSAPGYMKAAAVRKALGNLLPDDPRIDMALSNDPNLANRMKQLSEDSFAMSKSTRAELLKEGAAQKRTETQGENSLKVAETGAASRESVAATQVAGKIQAVQDKALSSVKDAAAAYRLQAGREQDPQKRAQLLQEAMFADRMATYTEQLKAATAKAGQLDIPGVAGLPGIANTTPPPMPVQQLPQGQPPQAGPEGAPMPPGAAGVNAQPSAQQRLIPAPQGRVRVFDPRTGQAHSVPAAQAEDALKQGYVTF